MESLFLLKDVARISGYSKDTLKYYLKIGLIKEVGRSSETNFRFFDHSTLKLLEKIHSFRRQGKSIKEIKNLLL